jgi:serralysin
LLQEDDSDGDGQPDSRTVWEYDQAGLNVTVSYDVDADGETDWREVVEEYGPAGRPSVYRQELPGGEVVGQRNRAFDDDGHVTGQETRDPGGDIRTVTLWAYDAEGRVVESRTGPGGDLWEWVSVWRYDAEGVVQSYESDWVYNNDDPDRPEEVFTAEAWHETGLATRWSIDLDNDGLEDQVQLLAVDDQGRDLGHTFTGEGDEGPDHDLVRVLRPDGQSLSEGTDWYRDGSMDDLSRWTYDATGRVTSSEWDWDGDGDPNETQRWTRDDRGRLQGYVSHNANGVFIMTAQAPCGP